MVPKHALHRSYDHAPLVFTKLDNGFWRDRTFACAHIVCTLAGDVPKPDSGSAVPLDPEIEGKLRAVKEAAENARREAAAAAQRRAEVLQEAGGAIPGAAGAAAGGSAGAGGAGAARPAALPEIATFEDFKRTERGGGKGHHHREGGSSKKSELLGSGTMPGAACTTCTLVRRGAWLTPLRHALTPEERLP